MAYGVEFNAVNSWANGFIGEITLSNMTLDPVYGWVIQFDATFEITNLWNAEIVSHTGSHYIIRNAAWNGTLSADSQLSFGFQASYTGEIEDPTGFIVNDVIIGDDPPEPVLPTITIDDVAVTEGDFGTSEAVFTLSLSNASDEAVTVAYATSDGTALGGADYFAASGFITFAPGETTKTITILVAADDIFEPSENFQLNLSGATNALIGDPMAIATIIDDDDAPLPILSVADITVDEGSSSTTEGFFSTQGNQIIDAAGSAVKIAGISWFGMESGRYSPDGLHARNYQDMMDQMVELGFNTIRLPFSNQLFDSDSVAQGINYALNPELAGLSGLEILDKIVDYAGEAGLRIILDHHRNAAGAGSNENGLWYTSEYGEQRWISDWTMLADRYAGNSTIIGADIHNEPHGPATWGGGGVNDWAAAAERAGNAIHGANSDWLIFVEGVDSYQGDNYWWGGNLAGVRDRPVQLEVGNKLVYSPHDYPNSIYAQPWFDDPSFPDNLPQKFDDMWGYIYREGIAPVYLGEFGSKLADPKDLAWLEKIQSYLAGDFDADGVLDIPSEDEGISWTWWSWNPNSGDTGGILQDDWSSVNINKVNELEALMFDFDVAGGTGIPVADGEAIFTVTLSAPAASAVSVDYHTVAGSATDSDFSAVAGTLNFAPGETTKTIVVAINSDTLVEGDEQFTLHLFNPVNATIGNFVANALIIDDDKDAPPPPPPPPPDPDDFVTASTTIVNDWGSGFTASVDVQNEGIHTVEDWTVEISMPYDITNIWNAEIVSHIDDVYVISGVAWNDDLGAGDVVNFGFQATPGSTSESEFDWLI